MAQRARYIELKVGVRYWEDSWINGVRDEDGKIPLRQGDYWCPTIDLTTGQVLDWPEGTKARIYYQVCDDGQYWLLNESNQRIAKWRDDYVPTEILSIGENGCGDYIIFCIGPDGMILDWTPPSLDPSEWKPL